MTHSTPVPKSVRLLDKMKQQLRFHYLSLESKYVNRKPDRYLNYYEASHEPVGRALVAYNVEPFYLPKFSPKFKKHQAVRESISIAKCLNSLGYIVDVVAFDDTTTTFEDYSEYDLLFGVGPAFDRFQEHIPDSAVSVFYAVTDYWEYLREAELRRLAWINEHYDADLKPQRTDPHIEDTGSEDAADAFIILGDERTRDTYLSKIGTKPAPWLYTSGFDFIGSKVNCRDYESARKRFLWFSGGGSALKGLHFLLEAATELPNIELNVCGFIDDNRFEELYYEELHETDNINFYGWTNVTSSTYERLAERCAYIVHPTASDASPGSVATCMHAGMVPILTNQAIYDVEDWGIDIPDDDLKTVKQTLRSATERSPGEVREMAQRAEQVAKERHTIEQFEKNMIDAFGQIIKCFDLPAIDSSDVVG